MNKIKTFSLGCLILGLAACQTAPKQYNGTTGYQIENQTQTTATISYTLAGIKNRNLDNGKLQHACQKVLGAHKTYQISILSTNEIANPAAAPQEQYGIQLGKSRTSIGLSNTPDLNSSSDFATQQALETRPSTLQVVRYTCS